MNDICPICYENIYLFYYTPSQCSCKIKLHWNCAIKCEKCIICRKNNNEIHIKYNKNLEKLILLISLFISIFFILYIYIYEH